jgi:ribosome biogenesis GTPase
VDLSLLGWTDERAAQLPPGLHAARVSQEHKGGYVVIAAAGELQAPLRKKLRGDPPAVGDWVGVSESGAIEAVLPRTSAFARKVAGDETRAQVAAANVDFVFLCTAVGGDFSPRRLERYAALAWQSGATPVVLLTKADLAADLAADLDLAQAAVPGADALAVSVEDGFGAVAAYAAGGRTLALLGSSGVGKSTIVNALLGAEAQAVSEVRAGDDKGRHTTSSRELFPLAGGGCIIDTPGMRELQLWDADLAQAFPEIAELAKSCRFGDCTHDHEPGCAVRDAVDPARLASWLKLASELDVLEARRTAAGRVERKAADRMGSKALRARLRDKGRR